MTESRTLKTGGVLVMLLPVAGRSIVLPSPAVAEVVGNQEPEPDIGAPDWLLGHIDWRGHKIPLLSFERALGQDPSVPNSQRPHIAVLYTLNGNRNLPYIGLMIHGNARLIRINARNLDEDASDAMDSPLIMRACRVNEESAWIPDLDELERMVRFAG